MPCYVVIRGFKIAHNGHYVHFRAIDDDRDP